MAKPITSSWTHFRKHFLRHPQLGISLEASRIGLDDAFFAQMAQPVAHALQSMTELERGAIANPDEGRMVGHYWLRDSRLAPQESLQEGIEATKEQILAFAQSIHSGEMKPERADAFRNVLVVGIGGSALGPQLVGEAIAPRPPAMNIDFFDNTDPDGMNRIIDRLGPAIAETLTVVISKSGGTKETRNGMLVAQAAYQQLGLDFAKHAVAVTGVGSALETTAADWLARFPMEDWVGGRTSVTSSVGLLPAALQGIDVQAMLDGAAEMDQWTRLDSASENPAMFLALIWHFVGNGRGEKDMVILPYKDSLALMSKYLQQLVMESLGKAEDLDGRTVNQGIAVYGNKGSTDQHAYIQQLRDGLNNFFATFIEVRQAEAQTPLEVEPGVYSGDYLQGFLRGTRQALAESGRQSLTISLPEVNPRTLGALIALFERAVGFYASLVNVNAYHQPGVEAGKKAAAAVLVLQSKVVQALESESTPVNAENLAAKLGADPEDVYHILVHLAANRPAVQMHLGEDPGSDTFSWQF
ncbi:MAG: glucose-6-phosphate isomerase [Verrucomicrobiales bacterium]